VFAEKEQLILSAAKGKRLAPSDGFVQLYIEDSNIPDLIAQLGMLPTLLKEVPIATMSDFIQWFMKPPDRFSLSEIRTLIRLVLVLPATNAISERALSTLRRVKSYMRSTMKESRLNACMTLHIYKDQTAKLDAHEIIRSFVGTNRRRAERIAH